MVGIDADRSVDSSSFSSEIRERNYTFHFESQNVFLSLFIRFRAAKKPLNSPTTPWHTQNTLSC